MNLRSKLLLSSILIVAIWEIAPRVLNKRPSTQLLQPAAKSEKDEVFEVVQSYVELANKGDSKNLDALTTGVPQGARINSVDFTPSRTDSTALNEIRNSFPETLANGEQRIHEVQKLLVKDGFAKVTITFESESFIFNSPRIFMLAKNPDGQWRIYDINGQYDAVEYLPVEAQEP